MKPCGRLFVVLSTPHPAKKVQFRYDNLIETYTPLFNAIVGSQIIKEKKLYVSYNTFKNISAIKENE